MIALPQVWLFQILLTTLAPLADLLLVWQLVGQWINYSQHGAEFQSNDLRTIGIYYCVFIVVDLLAAVIGFLMERRGRLESAVVADAAALRLSPDHVLCRGALHRHRAARPLCRLGQAGTARHRQGGLFARK